MGLVWESTHWARAFLFPRCPLFFFFIMSARQPTSFFIIHPVRPSTPRPRNGGRPTACDPTRALEIESSHRDGIGTFAHESLCGRVPRVNRLRQWRDRGAWRIKRPGRRWAAFFARLPGGSAGRDGLQLALCTISEPLRISGAYARFCPFTDRSRRRRRSRSVVRALLEEVRRKR